MSFPEAERERYSRHFILPQVGKDGQARLRAASVLCVGAGGLGSPTLMYLAAAGVGRIGVVDSDHVELSNLQRQIVHRTSSVGAMKTQSAMTTLRDLNPHIEITLHSIRLIADNVLDLFADYDVIIDGSDNFPTRFLVNDGAWFSGKPLVAGAIFQFDGQLSVFDRRRSSPCYRCLLPEPPDVGSVPSCDEAGVLGALPGVIGGLQAMEVLKLILNIGSPLTGRMLHYDALSCRFRELGLRQNPSCPLCGSSPTIIRPIDYQQTCSTGGIIEVDVKELRQTLDEGFAGILLDVRQPEEYEEAHLETSRHIPLGELEAALPNLDSSQHYLVYCKVGQRSAYAVAMMQEAGFRHVRNVAGGILAWRNEFGQDLVKQGV